MVVARAPRLPAICAVHPISYFDQHQSCAPLALAIYLLVVVGSIDDRFDLPAGVRLIARACAALLVVFGGGIVVVELGEPIFRRVSLGRFTPLFTILFVITLINTFKLIDGIDGLAGGVALHGLAARAIVGVGADAFHQKPILSIT